VVRSSVALIVVSLAAGACTACSSKAATPDPTPVTDDLDDTSADAGPPKPDTRPRVLITGSAGEAAVRVEVVDTDNAIMRGLMYRKYLAPDDGMLFKMGAEDDWGFWMKNTLIPLDIIFITRDFSVAGVLFDMKPMDKTSKKVGKPSLYVLEVNAGWAKAHGVAAGSTVKFDGIRPTD
jgi:uncharacterized protein